MERLGDAESPAATPRIATSPAHRGVVELRIVTPARLSPLPRRIRFEHGLMEAVDRTDNLSVLVDAHELP